MFRGQDYVLPLSPEIPCLDTSARRRAHNFLYFLRLSNRLPASARPASSALNPNGPTAGAAVANVAVTFFGASMVRVQVPVPVQSPDQPLKVYPVAGVAVSVTEESTGKGALHVEPQLIPEGLEDTLPPPAMETAIVGLTIAVTDLSPSRVRMQLKPCPAQSPDQPVNTQPEVEKFMYIVSCEPSGSCQTQVLVQLPTA